MKTIETTPSENNSSNIRKRDDTWSEEAWIVLIIWKLTWNDLLPWYPVLRVETSRHLQTKELRNLQFIALHTVRRFLCTLPPLRVCIAPTLACLHAWLGILHQCSLYHWFKNKSLLIYIGRSWHTITAPTKRITKTAYWWSFCRLLIPSKHFTITLSHIPHIKQEYAAPASYIFLCVEFFYLISWCLATN